MNNKIKELANHAKLLDNDGWNTTNLNIKDGEYNMTEETRYTSDDILDCHEKTQGDL
jgi:hypothetical protein